MILPTSALIGGLPLDNGRLVVHYEGNKYRAQSLKRYVMRCMHAHYRMINKEPTLAKVALLPEDLVQVGEYDPIRDRATCVLSYDNWSVA